MIIIIMQVITENIRYLMTGFIGLNCTATQKNTQMLATMGQNLTKCYDSYVKMFDNPQIRGLDYQS